MLTTYDKLKLVNKFGGTIYDPTVHEEIKGNGWADAVKNRLAAEGMIDISGRIFFFRHRIRKTFVLAVWEISPKAGQGFAVMSELFAFEQAPMGQEGDAPPMELVLDACRPLRVKVKEMKEAFDDKFWADAEQDRKNVECRKDMAKHLKKLPGMANDQYPQMLEKGLLPFDMGDD